MKYYVFAIVGSSQNDLSYSFYQMPVIMACDKTSLKEKFKNLREYINREFKKTMNGSLKSYAGYKFGINIAILDIKKDSCKNKRFYINPLNLR